MKQHRVWRLPSLLREARRILAALERLEIEARRRNDDGELARIVPMLGKARAMRKKIRFRRGSLR